MNFPSNVRLSLNGDLVQSNYFGIKKKLPPKTKALFIEFKTFIGVIQTFKVGHGLAVKTVHRAILVYDGCILLDEKGKGYDSEVDCLEGVKKHLLSITDHRGHTIVKSVDYVP